MNDDSKSAKFEFSFDEEEGYLLVTASGKVTFAAVCDYSEKVESFLAARGTTPILIDARAASALLRSTDLFNIARKQGKGAASACKRAFVHRPGVSGPVMYETVVRGLGQDLKMFTDVDEAKAWLLGEKRGGDD